LAQERGNRERELHRQKTSVLNKKRKGDRHHPRTAKEVKRSAYATPRAPALRQKISSLEREIYFSDASQEEWYRRLNTSGTRKNAPDARPSSGTGQKGREMEKPPHNTELAVSLLLLKTSTECPTKEGKKGDLLSGKMFGGDTPWPWHFRRPAAKEHSVHHGTKKGSWGSRTCPVRPEGETQSGREEKHISVREHRKGV